MKNDSKEAEKLTELLKKADGHPMMKAILAEEAAAVLVKRTEAVGKIEALTKERDEAIPRLQADLAGKEEKFNKAKAALNAATGEFNKAKAALYGENNRISHQIGLQEQVLFETAAPEIDEAITFFNEKLDFLRSPGRISRSAIGSEKNLIAWKKTTREESNAAAVKGALAYCQAAIKELERMKLSPALDMEKIEQMKAGVPSIDVYAEYQGEKPLERGPDPLAGLKSESHLNYELAKLNEKIKKVIKR